MRRRLNPYFGILMLVLMLTLSVIYAPIVVSQDSAEIISALEELQDDVSELPDDAFENTQAAKGQRTALINKIGAVIHQIEAGAYEGAVNKLENDLKNTVRLWITAEYEDDLLKEIDEIIRLIEGEAPPPPEDETPPNITSVLRVPETPNYNEDVTVIAQVEDEESGVDFVILSYSTNAVDWTNVTMNLEDGLYLAEIPAQSYNTNVSYKVYAYDKAGNSEVSDTYSYVVIDSYPPVISWVERFPISPNYNDTVLVTASVSEPEEASGVQLVILSYSDEATWTNMTMTLKEETIYEASIPELDYGTTVEYMIYASDNAENWAVSSTYSYIVGDEYPPTVRIDKPTQGSYVKGIVEITIFVSDDNLEIVELSINGTIVESWTSTGEHTYDWNTTTYIDGVYTLDLTAYDKAGNIAREAITVTVDQTLPSASINTPMKGSYLKGLVIISVTGADDNFEKMQLYIDTTLVVTLNASGTYTYVWNTSNYIDGVHIITLKVCDKADNMVTVEIAVTVDNTPPAADVKQPVEHVYLKGTLNIVVYGDDINFHQMKLYIDDNLVETWIASGEQTYVWDTTKLFDGAHIMKLIVFDKAGNLAEKTFSVTVDNTLPTAIINTPAEEAFLRGTVVIDVTGEDANLEKMELRINDVTVKTWTTGGSQTYLWNTEVDGIDGAYTITLTVYDKAGNSNESSVTVIVDNTLPVIRIDEPLEGSYLAGIVDIKVFIQEDNLNKVELTINGTEVVSWTLSGEHVFSWDTITITEGIYFIKLNALDKAGNIGEKTIKVMVDNTSPIIEAAEWTPKEPSIDEQVDVTAKVSDSQPSSGIQSVTLWYRNTTMVNYKPIPMSLSVTSGNWTATIPAQSTETKIEFYIEALDNAGNKVVSDEIYEYQVIAPAGIPLAWIVAIILLILAAIAAAIYFWRKRRKKKQDTSSGRVKDYKLTLLLCF